MNTNPLNILSLGGGVQSSTILLMSLHGELPPLDYVIFADTGWEPAGVYRQIDYLEQKCATANVPFLRVTRGNIRRDLLECDNKRVGRIGQPPYFVKTDDPTDAGGMLWRECSSEYKIKPIVAAVRYILGYEKGQRIPPGVRIHQWLGISFDERHRIKDSKKHYIKNVFPLVDVDQDYKRLGWGRVLSRSGCIEWLENNRYQQPPKSSCIGCPYHSDRYWSEMKEKTPQEFADAVEVDHHIRNTIPGVAGKSYMHSSFSPLEQVDFTTEVNDGQLTAFGLDGECDGVCGT